MYCRKCGNKIGDTDHYCQYCGTPTDIKEPPSKAGEPEQEKEEIVFNPPYDKKSHFAEEETSGTEGEQEEPEEDLSKFISDTEIDVEKDTERQEEETSGPQTAKSSEFNWNVHEFPTKKETEDIKFNWNMEDFGSHEHKEAAAAAFEEELFREIRDESNRIREQNIDRFFTFSRKNEEFQKLLDREYEKFKLRSGPSKAIEEPEIHREETELTQPQPEEEVPEEARYEELPLDTEVPAEEFALQDPDEKPEEEAVPAEAGEPEQPEEEAVPAEIPESEEPEEEAVPAEIPEPGQPEETGHISEMARARALFFGEELIRDNESIKKKLVAEEPEQWEDPLPATQEMNIDVAAAETPEEEPDHPVESSVQAEEPESEWDEEKPRKSAGQIILVIIAVVLAAEIFILGIRYFAPESLAARMINDAQTRIVQVVSGWADGISGLFSGNDSNNSGDDESGDEDKIADDPDSDAQQPDDSETPPPAPDPNPMADKNALVSSQLGYNINIEEIRANEALAYKPGKDYGNAGINSSKPITNNVWQTPENAEPVYYDQAVVGTVIAFDSQWIDYVNNGSKGVLDLLKKDSEAYRKAASFTKVGKIEETFKLLEIGEIRQGSNGFYVWAHEEIQITEKGKTTNQKYNWIYYLEPIDGKMRIVNYFKFQ